MLYILSGRNTLGSVDLDTTLPLTTAAFWQFAHSQDFYRSTRQQSVTVRQEVSEAEEDTDLSHRKNKQINRAQRSRIINTIARMDEKT